MYYRIAVLFYYYRKASNRVLLLLKYWLRPLTLRRKKFHSSCFSSNFPKLYGPAVLENTLGYYWGICKTEMIKKFMLKQSFRNSHRRCSIKKDVIKNFTKFTGTLLKAWLWHKCFLVNFVRFLRTLFSQSTSGGLLLKFYEVKRQHFLLSKVHFN